MNFTGPLFEALASRMGDLPNYPKAIGAPELSGNDLEDLKASTRKVFDFMRDGEWHAATAIIEASGVREGLRRLRELRQRGHTVECRGGKGREFEYRLIHKA
jgi:hypothetical protein